MSLYVKFECVTCENKNCMGHGLPTTEKICDGYKHTTTNADRIRSMSDEELADWFADMNKSSAFCPNDGEGIDCQDDCEKCWFDWLKEEAEEGKE